MSPVSGSLYSAAVGGSGAGISLDGIVREYLTNQHALCQNPVVTCPTFDLFHPHRCPEPRTNRISSAYNNICHRITHRSYAAPRLLRGMSSSGNMRGSATALTLASLDRRFIFSKYRASDIIKPPTAGTTFTTNCFSTDDKSLYVGTMSGSILMYNLSNPSLDESVFEAHHGAVTHLTSHKSGRTLLSSCYAVSEAMLWNLEDVYGSSEPLMHLSHCQHAIFTGASDKIVGTMDSTATLYDVETKKEIHAFRPTLSNHYQNNRADMHPDDDLIMTDGVLFDVRSGREIHKFDKINPVLNGTFHRNGLEVISSSEVWDLRTYHLLRTVPSLHMCNVVFNNARDVIFGTTELADNDHDTENFDTSFKVIDAIHFSSIATVDTRSLVTNLSVSHTDAQLSLVEAAGCQEELNDDTVIRLYDVGMTRREEDEDPMSEDESEDLNSEDDESDDTDDEDQQHDDGPGSDGGPAILFSDDDDDDNSDSDDSSQDDDAYEDGNEDDGSDVIIESGDEFDEGGDLDDEDSSPAVFFELSSGENAEGGAAAAGSGSSRARNSSRPRGVTWLRSQLAEAMADRACTTASTTTTSTTTATTSTAPSGEPMDEEEDQWEDIGEEGEAEEEDEEEEL